LLTQQKSFFNLFLALAQMGNFNV